MTKTLAIIPARYGSTRFPGKPLVDIKGKTMIQRVYQKAIEAKLVDKVIVATDDQRIYDQVLAFNGEVIMTASHHQSGTDRCGEVATLLTEYDVIINIQGDEPFIPSEMIDELIIHFKNNPNQKITTLVKIIEDSAQLFNPHCVKTVIDTNGNALYFSRQPIPYQQGVLEIDWLDNHDYFRHIGLYVFNRNTLLDLVKLPPSKLEKQERLEQLRWLESGYSIGVGVTNYDSVGIDTPEDLSRLN